MAGTIKGRMLHNGDEAVRFNFELDGVVHKCMVSRELLNDLSQSTSSGDEILGEFDAHVEVIMEKTELAIRGGLAGDPLLIPSEMFFPRGRMSRS
ncbi:DUF1488 family protein [Paraburkholderia nemoris]|uniref:DUF1488 family protein n=1 Tax=Paraburkholderia nemoris TaxID=2793076 RepID=UPI001B0DC19E|nr:DUF1488 family protein [Paraburkholderia nemoris]CAE6839588.1 hypothetical protein R75777_07006 [Paraburkholderia nemoris]